MKHACISANCAAKHSQLGLSWHASCAVRVLSCANACEQCAKVGKLIVADVRAQPLGVWQRLCAQAGMYARERLRQGAGGASLGKQLPNSVATP